MKPSNTSSRASRAVTDSSTVRSAGDVGRPPTGSAVRLRPDRRTDLVDDSTTRGPSPPARREGESFESLATLDRDETTRVDPSALVASMADPMGENEETRVIELTPELLAMARGETRRPRRASPRSQASSSSARACALAIVAALATAVAYWITLR